MDATTNAVKAPVTMVAERDPWFPQFAMPVEEEPIAVGYARQQLAKALAYLEQGKALACCDAANRAVQALDDLQF